MLGPDRARTREAGFSLIEVLIGVLVLTVGLLATVAALISANHLNLTTQRVQAAATVAEQSMEQLRAMTYSQLALSSLPSHSGSGNATGDTSGDPADPDYWVSASNLLIVANYNLESSPTLSGVSSGGEPMVSGGTVSPGPSVVSSEGFSVTVYRFVSWVSDACTYLGLNLCPGSENAKRITVAAILTSGGGLGASKPFWLSTVVANPDAGVL